MPDVCCAPTARVRRQWFICDEVRSYRIATFSILHCLAGSFVDNGSKSWFLMALPACRGAQRHTIMPVNEPATQNNGGRFLCHGEGNDERTTSVITPFRSKGRLDVSSLFRFVNGNLVSSAHEITTRTSCEVSTRYLP